MAKKTYSRMKPEALKRYPPLDDLRSNGIEDMLRRRVLAELEERGWSRNYLIQQLDLGAGQSIYRWLNDPQTRTGGITDGLLSRIYDLFGW